MSLQDQQWFHCDDEAVSCATLSDVLGSEAYMLFYIKARLDYSTSTPV
jgi:ubiquitin carboxyl-terminal hydrolase 22/27/51